MLCVKVLNHRCVIRLRVLRAGSNIRILGKTVAFLNPNAAENLF